MAQSHFHVVRLHNGASIISLPYTTRAVIRSSADGDDRAIGSLAISSTDGRAHLKIADNNADADWRKITVTDAD
jgi:hypothetical protein